MGPSLGGPLTPGDVHHQQHEVDDLGPTNHCTDERGVSGAIHQRELDSVVPRRTHGFRRGSLVTWGGAGPGGQRWVAAGPGKWRWQEFAGDARRRTLPQANSGQCRAPCCEPAGSAAPGAEGRRRLACGVRPGLLGPVSFRTVKEEKPRSRVIPRSRLCSRAAWRQPSHRGLLEKGACSSAGRWGPRPAGSGQRSALRSLRCAPAGACPGRRWRGCARARQPARFCRCPHGPALRQGSTGSA